MSLIELLVSISVLVILAGILIPVAYRSVSRAQQSTCASNLRQCYTAIQNYAADNDGEYPPPQAAPDGSDNWTLRVVPYYSEENASFLGRGNAPRVQICPTNRERINEYTGRKYSSYFAMNFALGPSPAYPPCTIKKNYNIPRPASTILLTEAGYTSSTTVAVCDGTWLLRSARYNGVYEGGVHGGANNILWCDGHISPFDNIQKLIPPGNWYAGPKDYYFAPGFSLK